MITWSPGMTLDGLEKAVIKAACKYYPSKTATAAGLGIAIRTLDNKLEKYAEEDKSERDFDHQRRIDSDKALARARGQSYVESAPRASGPTREERELKFAQSCGYAPAPGATHVSEAGTTVRVESPVTVTTKQAVPVPKRTEVQSVLPKETAANGSQKSRR